METTNKQMTAEELTQLVESTFRWGINSITDSDCKPIDNNQIGYFGLYERIKVQGKECIVLLELSERYPKVITDWFDKIYYGREDNAPIWDADYRWNDDVPLVVRNGDAYNLCKVHNKGVLLDKWVGKFYNFKPIHDKMIGDYYEAEAEIGEKDYNKTIAYVTITTKGTLYNCDCDSLCERAVADYKLTESLNSVEEIIDAWISNDKPCAYIRGMRYKGAKSGKVDMNKAMNLIQTHHRFDGMFNSASWDLIDGQVTLLFHDYADSDFD